MENMSMNNIYRLVIIFLLAALVLVGCGSKETVAPTPHPGQALVQTKCSTCHTLAQVDNAKYSREMWQATVDRMVLAGMQITDEQKELIVDYLALRDAK